MLLMFVLLLINGFKGSSGAEHETLCTSNVCFTLHMEKVSFEKAKENCFYNGGYLMTVRDREEEDVLRLLLSKIPRQRQDKGLKFWIGLKLHGGDCMEANKTLKGFKWVSGEEDSNYSNWEKEPVDTCFERCVRFDYMFSGPNPMKWAAGPCRSTAFYACKFYFKGMCDALSLLGPGQITYIVHFSEEPLRSDMKSLPPATYAEIACDAQEPQQSVCACTDDTYRWTVPGPFCSAEEETCAVNNGGCEHLCHEDADEARCSCREGYDLDADGFSCRVTDSCAANTCEHLCVMGETGYSCRCPDGFKLDSNQRSCSDIDECQSHTCHDHLCVNTHGSYTCECKDGHELVDGRCGDVDECAHSKCDHSCLNTVGSFSCHCREGFTLSKDGHSCVDINECVSNRCPFECVNTAGSFSCACPRGFHLDTTGVTCAADVTAVSSHDQVDEESQDNFTESSSGTTVGLQQSTQTDAPLPGPVNGTQEDRQGNTSLATSSDHMVNSRVIICVLGSVIPLLLLVAVTVAIAVFRCSRSREEAKKKPSTDGYCWVSSGLDPRLEKLYASILTDDL